MHILDERVELSTPWFDLVSKRTSNEAAPYYSLRMLDYVTVLALTTNEECVFVRQYRPAVARHTLELPSGHVERGESPETAARRELAEETGFQTGRLELLGSLLSDTGRNENRLWCFFAPDVTSVGASYKPEPGVETVLIPRTELSELIARSEFEHALDLAVVCLAVLRHGPALFALKDGTSRAS